MTQPHNGSHFQQGPQNPQQPTQPFNHSGPNGAQQYGMQQGAPYGNHQAGPYGAGALADSAFAEPQKKSSSAAIWILLAVIIVMLLLLGVGFFLVRGLVNNDDGTSAPTPASATEAKATAQSTMPTSDDAADTTDKDTADGEKATQAEAAPLAPLEGLPEDYFDHSLSIEEAEKIREGDLKEAPVPEELAGLSDTCVQGASFFGKPDDQGFFSSGMVPTITCFFGEEGEFMANYTRNEDAIAAAAKPGKEHKEKFESLADTIDIVGTANEVKTTRGSMLFMIYNSYEGETEYVMSEVLAGETAAIEYISNTSEVLLRQPLIDAGIVERVRK
ncbi:hypothetical protein [uncultured Corynebacterium sp.]|mgnify:CR=1 FL=1|uniref:hypothetical protein n=1 Tax=uncultured Corynebacterium sp. TaxID=159447 RepID=UPI0025F39D10|nr:hypothetical protein [uncultured Corynebacterium sp.]